MNDANHSVAERYPAPIYRYGMQFYNYFNNTEDLKLDELLIVTDGVYETGNVIVTFKL